MTMRPLATRGGSYVFPLILAITAAAAVACALDAGPVNVWIFVVVIGGWLITLSLHEFAHAAVSLAGGDTSVRERGYLTLNLLRYSDPANTFLIPLILLAIGGIPLPGGAVLVEPWRLRHRWWSSLVSAAGPVTNMLCGVVLAWISAGIDNPLGYALAALALLQFVAGILNILPIPGFDGFGILEPYLPRELLERLRPIRPWLPLVVFAILWSVDGASAWLFNLGADLMETFGGNVAQAAVGLARFRFWNV
ncbi:site-2 protease family protein [Nakamurella aerolata]|nr:site-2 protease family protein [Nakamurella aerolata]